jgi:lipooligosaccharide transport system permease protein
MVTTIAARRIAGSDLRPSRAAAVTERNFILFKAAGSYGWLVVAGLAEPVLYLLAMGWGVGSLVGSVTLPGGQVVAYAAFIAPAMLAASAMNGALAESTINFAAKLRYWRLYDAILNTPVTPSEVAVGELGWAMARGGMYSTVFLVIMVALGWTRPLLALLALPAALLSGFAFGALGMAIATFLRTWQQFDYVGIVTFALFMLSGTFVPISSFPAALQVIVQLTPLYHAVELIRGIALDHLAPGLLWHAGYLVVLAAVGLTIASRRMRLLLSA